MRVLLLAGLLLAGSHVIASPESNYMIHCMGCHLADGQGMPPDIPAFNNTLTGFAGSAEGRAYIVRVPGAAQAPLDDQALADVLNWILDTYTSQPFKTFNADEVGSLRQEIMKDAIAVRASLVDE